MRKKRRAKQTTNVYKSVFLSIVLISSILSFILFLESESAFGNRFVNFLSSYNQFDSRSLSRIELFGIGSTEDENKQPDLTDSDVIRRSFIIQSDNLNFRTLKSGKEDVITIGNDTHDVPANSRFLLVATMYEQLGRSVEEFFQASAVAKNLGRYIVQPFIQDSRLSGLPVDLEGNPLQSFGDYFDIDVTNMLLSTNGYASLVDMEQFHMYCDKTVQKSTIVHFLYKSDEGREVTRKAVRLSDHEYDNILRRTEGAGYIDCAFLDNRFSISRRLVKIRAGRQVCVNPEVVRTIRELEYKVLRNDNCVIFVDWRGLSESTTHFQPTVKTSSKVLTHQLQLSDKIVSSARDFASKNLSGESFVSVHVRSERQILWYGFERFQKCIDLVIKFVEAIKSRESKIRVFLATDMLENGSDTLPKDIKIQDQIKSIYESLVKRLDAAVYKAMSGENKGFIALTEMSILTEGAHFISLGTGALQEWAVEVFMNKHSSVFGPVIKRVCYKEVDIRTKKP